MKRKSGFAVCVLALASACTPGVSMTPAAGSNPGFDLQGHRGARGLRPENTLAGFRYALGLGVATLEMDAGVTKDGVVVVSHDRALNPNHTRDADGRFLTSAGPLLRELTLAELQQYDVGRIQPGSKYAASFSEQLPMDGERIPRLADVFALVERSGNRRVRFNIETKIEPLKPGETVEPEPFVQALVAVIRNANVASRTTIQSFDWRTLVFVRKLAPDIAIVALTDQQPGEDTMEIGKPGASVWLGGLDVDDYGGSVPRTVQAIGAHVWSPHWLDIDARSVAEAHGLGLTVVPWSDDNPEDRERVLALSVDGMISDYPDRWRTFLDRKRMAVPEPTPVR